ncbi:MAG TPA: family 43 glycosylhydrolase, partial [Cellvibrionaceae bacterium]
MSLASALRLLSALAFACMLSVCTLAEQVSIHDPVMIREDGTYYLFSTGPGTTFYRSDDKVEWQLQGRVFDTEPKWARDVAPGFSGHLWAPDIIEKDGDYYLYYSVSAFGRNTSAIGLTVTKTLDASSPDYRWEDQGIVIQSVPHRDNWNAIDPHVVVDDEGAAWMSFGSFWGGLKLFKLNEQWNAPAEPAEWYTIAKGDRPALIDDAYAGPVELEAPFIFKQNGYYYLFISLGKCCRGAESTYHLAVGRSKTVTGPYIDREGTDLAAGGGTVVLKGNAKWPGLGHNSAYTFDGKDYLV